MFVCQYVTLAFAGFEILLFLGFETGEECVGLLQLILVVW